MARKPRADVSTSQSFSSSNSMPGPAAARRRGTLRDPHSSPVHGETVTPKIINAAPSLEKAEMYGIDDERPTSSRIMALFGRMFMETIPQLLVVGAMLGLIFGGCCSNRYVFAIPTTTEHVLIWPGTLLTFVQFLFVAITGYVSQFDISRPPFFLAPNRVPIRRWLINIALFFTINVLNNHAFSYNISVPVHIILRSGGSITTIFAGYLWGKRYSRLQVISVLLLTVGVFTAAWSDSQSKVLLRLRNSRSMLICEKERPVDTQSGLPPFSIGLIILFFAQVLSAIMGLYTEETYREYGPHWKENLFYSHFLSLPLFVPFIPSMARQFMRLAASEPLEMPFARSLAIKDLPEDVQTGFGRVHIPSQLAYLVVNILTQYACIRGVNLLASAASALTVTIVLNVRKLISLLLSIWLFGNRLSPGTLIGAIIVFTAGGMYSLDGGKGIGRARRRVSTNNVVNGKVEK
ncbi:MAG: golgi uridine diphosphate-N- acetylglucosamine transporter [Claussenomyces sp. TS43310]|nr:MAG: golgi uridine diphosphate-N- acetylglucosamine transporter [Claussenomyces sp. TS43310]